MENHSNSLNAWKATNYKGRLIEYCHSNSLETPTFKLRDISGPDHRRTFEISVKIGNQNFESSIETNNKTAEQGAEKAMISDRHLLEGLNIYQGVLTYQAVAEAQGKKY